MIPNNNPNRLILGTAEFAFSQGAATRAQSATTGFRKVGNLTAYQPNTTNDTVDHEGSYRGRKIVDESFSIKQGLEYVLKADEFGFDNMMLLLMGSAGTDHLQDALVDANGDPLLFSPIAPSNPNSWYDLYKGGAHLRSLTSVTFPGKVFTGATVVATTDLFTATLHGLVVGQAIQFSGGSIPTGLTAFTTYYVIATGFTVNTFKVAATPGGVAVNVSIDGTVDIQISALILPVVQYELDLDLGQVRFFTPQVFTATPLINAPAITAADDTFLSGIKPIQQTNFAGYGRLTVYHQKTEKAIFDHQDFSCVVTAQKISEGDGKKPSEFEFHVRVTADEGNFLVGKRAL